MQYSKIGGGGQPFCINISMLISEVVEAKASAELCKSNKPNSELGASQLASCKSQGLRARDTKRKYKIRGKTASIDGRRSVVASMAAVYQYTVKRTVLTHRKAVQTTSLKQVYRVLQMIEEQLKLVSIIA